VYVSHEDGLLRLDASAPARPAMPVAGTGSINIAGLHSIGWHEGALVGVQRVADGHAVVRLRLSRDGTRAVAHDVLQHAVSSAGVLAGSTYYYVSESDTALALRGISIAR
jgi:hypothetical protein